MSGAEVGKRVVAVAVGVAFASFLLAQVALGRCAAALDRIADALERAHPAPKADGK